MHHSTNVWVAGVRRVALASAAAGALLVGAATTAVADPPAAIPASSTPGDAKWQPATDYDVEGCYPTPAVGPGGEQAPGLALGGANNGQCRDDWDLDATNSYARTECQGEWCAHKYAYYFEKDQRAEGVAGPGNGHRHDLEHVVVWVQNDQARFVSASAHGGYDTRPADQVLWEGSHPKIVYHKDGAGTHAFRFAADHDDPPENHRGVWQYPALVSWGQFPPGVQEAFVAHDYGSATLALKDCNFQADLAKAKPEEVPFGLDTESRC